jgi:ABC-type antimicrobial peptide transport system permease subunit
VADIADGPPETPTHAAAYIPFDQIGFGLLVRTAQAERVVLPSVVAAIREVRPDLMVASQAMSERIKSSPSATMQWSLAWLVAGFAVMALLLSVVGLYGVVAYSVGQRTREIGVRMALGAQQRSIYRLVMGNAAAVVVIGTVVGTIGAVGAASMIRRLLFGVESWDAATLIGAAAVLVVPALFASYIPARRATSLNPIEVLRVE